MFSGSSGAARLSLAVVIVLIVLKVVVGAITGSLSIMAQAVDSFLDLFAVAVTLIAIRIAAKPADEEHPFGDLSLLERRGHGPMPRWRR